MADLESVIAGSLSDAGIGESVDSGADTSTEIDNSGDYTPDTPADSPDQTTSDDPGTAPEEAPAEAPAEEPVVEEVDQITKDLEELGLRAPKEGERENRLPHSRVKRIAENYGKKVEARFTQELTTLKTQNSQLVARSQQIDRVDHLIKSDPERYITMLSTIHPEYKRFLGGAPAADKPAGKPATAASPAGPRPQPDVTFADKSRGYSPEQHDKLLDWIKADAKAEARREVEEWVEAKYGPIAKSFEARQALNEQIPIVRQRINNVYETWGQELVEQHEPEIVQLMQQYPQMGTEEAVARILVPKVRADRNTMRNELIAETRTRPAAAAKLVPGAASAGKDLPEQGGDPIENAIRRSLRARR